MTDTTAPDELVLERLYEAPPELVFECLTNPEHLSHFWGPVGTHAPADRMTVDLRPGGEFRTVMVNDSDGAEYPTAAVYVEVDRPRRLVWTEPGSGMTTALSFVDLGDGRTRVVVRQTDVPEPARTPQARAGMATSLDRCARYVAELAVRR
ncbi:SRPBCC family protein [Nakamurella endophytica]|uniref:Activator of Hsp90 ATPase homologue 1/2-like C-terminal domain-containing protein n=1 Tax=Nakamurella endophytica TaxID=1748367 RepID=A0A917SJN7_9ACTN|nr:SRPBCC domain-containing protein [Nakamurella endophytica]GGL85708.1 hypothetical protein GCM10011594_01730 [Nakamurella endophytica]